MAGVGVMVVVVVVAVEGNGRGWDGGGGGGGDDVMRQSTLCLILNKIYSNIAENDLQLIPDIKLCIRPSTK